jgi:hypothetical protein
MGKVIDFVSYNGWGHAIHGETMREVTDYGSWLTRWLDKRKNITRKSFMVHSMSYPKIGDVVRYKVSNGIRQVEIYDVRPCRDPDDMFTLFCIFKPQSKNHG